MRDRRCEQPRGWLQLRCDGDGWIMVPRRCRECAGCREWWRARQVARGVKALEGVRWASLLTLTSLPGTSWPSLMKSWSEFVRELRAKSGTLAYMAVKEEGAVSGMRHLHVLITGPGAVWTDWLWMSSVWKRLTGARGVHIKRVSTVGEKAVKAVWYVLKYVGKGFGLTAPTRKLMTASALYFKKVMLSGHWWLDREEPGAQMHPYGAGWLCDLKGVWVIRECKCKDPHSSRRTIRLDTIPPPSLSSLQSALGEI